MTVLITLTIYAYRHRRRRDRVVAPARSAPTWDQRGADGGGSGALAVLPGCGPFDAQQRAYCVHRAVSVGDLRSARPVGRLDAARAARSRSASHSVQSRGHPPERNQLPTNKLGSFHMHLERAV